MILYLGVYGPNTSDNYILSDWTKILDIRSDVDSPGAAKRTMCYGDQHQKLIYAGSVNNINFIFYNIYFRLKPTKHISKMNPTSLEIQFIFIN